MRIPRNEIRTGLFVLLTLAVLVAALLYLGAPGTFVRLHTYKIYFDNAEGIKPGADVMVAGRKVGQVTHIHSPVPARERPDPKYESLVEVRVAAVVEIYNKVRVQMVQLTMLGDMMIDFSHGDESSGLAGDGAHFLGERQPGLSDAVPLVLEKLEPVLRKTTETLDSLQTTSRNLAKLTSQGADLQEALAEFHNFCMHLNELTAPGGSLRISLENIQTLTAPDGALAKTLHNTEKITGNGDIEETLRNARQSSGKLNRTMGDLGPRLSTVGRNLEEASDTVKRQPWRLIWPTTKKYPEDKPRPAQSPSPTRTTDARKTHQP